MSSSSSETPEVQRVVVIQDASRELSSTAVEWAIDGLPLRPGDELTLLGVLHQVFTPMGYKSRIASNSMLAANAKIIDEEVARRKEEYQNSAEILSICKLYESKNIGFNISVVAASSPKVAAVDAADKLKATWIILDRQMKKDKHFFMEKLPCGIYRMKRNNGVELLREPKASRRTGELLEANIPITYEEMLPGLEERSPVTLQNFSDDEDDLFSLDFSPLISKPPGTADIKRNLSSSTKHSSVKPEEDDQVSLKIATEEMLSKWEHELEIPGGGEAEYPVCKECGNRRPRASTLREFTYGELHNATKGFSDENFLSEGGFGSVYKGRLGDGQWIAVKQYKLASSQGGREFRAEVRLLGRLRHENVVMLLGSCSEGNRRLLVYEYVCNGSLEQRLSKSSPTPLSWEQRMKIALGAATGLNYLHKNDVIHRDMRPNNILLTHDHETMLGDFGLSRKQQKESTRVLGKKVVGTFGYLAPEYTERGRISTKTDVYSFGVVLLELVAGRTATDKSSGAKGLVEWARPLLGERKYHELIDERLLGCLDLHQLFWLVTVVEQCLRRNPDARPSMDKVEGILQRMIEGEATGGNEDLSPSSLVSSWTSLEEQDVAAEEEIYSSFTGSRSRTESTTTTSAASEGVSVTSSTTLPQSSSSDASSATKSKSFWNKIGGKSSSQRIKYDEMLT